MNSNHSLAVKIGGSLLAPRPDGGIDWDYLALFKELIVDLVEEHYRIGISTGGGELSRKYVSELQQFDRDIPKEELHKVGVSATNLNISVLASVFEEYLIAPPFIYNTHDKAIDGLISLPETPGVVLFGASKPGYSNDWNAVQLARLLKANRVVSAKNVDGVYTADPRKDDSAIKLDTLTWDKYFEIIGGRETHDPGASYPVGPYAAHLAESEKINFIVVGSAPDNIKLAVLGQEFIGSTIASL